MSNMTGQMTYSYSSLSKWRECKQKWRNAYLMGQREPTTPNMAAGTWLLEKPVQDWHSGIEQNDAYWEAIWANYLAEFNGDASFDHPLFNIDTAKQMLSMYKTKPMRSDIVSMQSRYWHRFPGGYAYQSKPDFVIHRSGLRGTIDLKLQTVGSAFFKPEPLSPFDDQCLGQAVLASCTFFGKIIFRIEKRSAKIEGPIFQEQAVDEGLAQQWLDQTAREIADIESYMRLERGLWPKNSQACDNWGRQCPYLKACKAGVDMPKKNR